MSTHLQEAQQPQLRLALSMAQLRRHEMQQLLQPLELATAVHESGDPREPVPLLALLQAEGLNEMVGVARSLRSPLLLLPVLDDGRCRQHARVFLSSNHLCSVAGDGRVH